MQRSELHLRERRRRLRSTNHAARAVAAHTAKAAPSQAIDALRYSWCAYVIESSAQAFESTR